jgi:hypothetical protein
MHRNTTTGAARNFRHKMQVAAVIPNAGAFASAEGPAVEQHCG